jgi:hypothetical protein
MFRWNILPLQLRGSKNKVETRLACTCFWWWFLAWLNFTLKMEVNCSLKYQALSEVHCTTSQKAVLKSCENVRSNRELSVKFLCVFFVSWCSQSGLFCQWNVCGEVTSPPLHKIYMSGNCNFKELCHKNIMLTLVYIYFVFCQYFELRSVKWRDDLMNWKGSGRKQPWPSFGYCRGIFLEGLGKPIKTGVRITSFLVKIRTNTSWKYYCLSHLSMQRSTQLLYSA